MNRRRHALQTSARTIWSVAAGAMLLAACTAPPKAPSVDETTRRPVNARTAVDLRACQSDLSRATLLVSEMVRSDLAATALRLASMTPVSTMKTVDTSQAIKGTGNLVAVVTFALGSSTLVIGEQDAAALVRRANESAVIMIRGRTDATADSMRETALARRRAHAAAGFMVQAGVPRDRLRLTWQGAGDPVAGLRPDERGQSRRVEIEFHSAAPMRVSLSGAANGKSAFASSL